MKKFIHISIIFAIAFFLVNSTMTESYVSGLRSESAHVTKEKDPLYEEISARSANYMIPAIDAKVDPVWKAIPGLNGVKVDIEASYKKMKKDGSFNEEKLVFQQIKPKVHLIDLPPSPIYKGNPDKPMVSFIINVAWGNEYLADMLATLKKHKVTASFFLEGRWVKNNPDLAKMIVDAGHEVGNHSYTHPNMKIISSQKAREEIQKTNEVIEATTEESIKWFAPPSGSYRDEIIRIAAQEKLGTVMWTVDTIDWKKPSPEQLINRVLSKIHNGAMILMHPTDSTANSLDQLILGIKQKDLHIGTVSDLLSEDRMMNVNIKNKNHELGKNSSNDIN